MKKFNLKTSAVCLVLSFTFLIGCSSENETSAEEITPLKASISSSESQAKQIVDAVIQIQEEITNAGADHPLLVQGLNQRTIDSYVQRFGLQGIITSDIKTLNEITANIGEATDNGIDKLINSQSYSDYAKKTLAILASGNTIENLEKERGFSGIPVEEQELLSFNNTLLKEYISRSSRGTRDHCGEPCTASIAGAGAVIGGVICGPPCAAGGLIIGVIIGVVTK